jgi:hypothetical protein
MKMGSFPGKPILPPLITLSIYQKIAKRSRDLAVFSIEKMRIFRRKREQRIFSHRRRKIGQKGREENEAG